MSDRAALIFAGTLLAAMVWGSFFFRYQPMYKSTLLDRWRGEVIDAFSNDVVPLEKHRLAVIELQGDNIGAPPIRLNIDRP